MISGKKYISSTERLLDLPDAFRGADLTLRFNWNSKQTSQYLYLWKKRKLINSLGGHSDTFVNLLTTANRPDWGQAARLAMPSAVIIGVDALRAAGWTTQIMSRPEIAVSKRYPVYSIDHYEVVPMSHRRIKAIIHQGADRSVEGGIPVMDPSWALAEMLFRQGWGKCGLHPDDVEPWFETEEDAVRAQAQWHKACKAIASFHKAPPCVLNMWDEAAEMIGFSKNMENSASFQRRMRGF